MPLSVQAAIYKKGVALYRDFDKFLDSDDGYLSAEFWYSLESLMREWNEGVSDMPDCLKSGTLRRAFIQMQDRIHDYDMSDVPEPTADLLSSIAYVLTHISEWPNMFTATMQPESVHDLFLAGDDYQTIAKKYNLVNPTTGIGVASMAEEEHKNPGTYIAPDWKHPREIERIQNREIIEEMLLEAESEPDVEIGLPSLGSSEDIDRFASLYEDVEPEELIEQAKKLGIVVRSNMKRETILGKIYHAVNSVEETVDG
jgi:hypothetical protein